MKRVLICLLAFAFLILAGCVNTISPNEYISSDSDIAIMYNGCIDSCSKCEESCNDAFFTEISGTNKDITLCDNVKNKDARESCKDSYYIIKAISENDGSYCERIKEESTKVGCHINVIKENAVSKRDPNLCNALAENAKDCKVDVVFTLVQQTGDKKYCDKLEGENSELCLES